uniref:Uncharacterized protein n=1 Tax=Marseillevirus LCMAC103 TaxID=2506604 RepID=A0A481YUC5_9VIRU|nr:MAG: hypothetical protein LCMAC103_01040 [Marseillevirus LCMAC103]
MGQRCTHKLALTAAGFAEAHQRYHVFDGEWRQCGHAMKTGSPLFQKTGLDMYLYRHNGRWCVDGTLFSSCVVACVESGCTALPPVGEHDWKIRAPGGVFETKKITIHAYKIL